MGRAFTPSGAADRVEEAVAYVDGVRTFYRRVPGDGPPTLFVHGNPTHSEDWIEFMARLDGPSLALDLPGWGYSERPGRDRFDYSMLGLGRFVERFREAVGVGEHSLVVHDWGVVGLIAAQRAPDRVRRLVVINAVPLQSDYRWHWVARYLWRVPVAGELANAATTKAALRLISRRAVAGRRAVPAELIDRAWSCWGGSRPEMLALYRSADPDRLAAAGAGLGGLECPALVVWGLEDRYLPSRFGRAYAERLPRAELVEVAGAGHWPWLDRPETIEMVVRFLGG